MRGRINSFRMAGIAILFITVLYIASACEGSDPQNGESDMVGSIEFQKKDTSGNVQGFDSGSGGSSRYSHKYESFCTPEDAPSEASQDDLPNRSSGGIFSHCWRLSGKISEVLENGEVAAVQIDRDIESAESGYLKDVVYVDLTRLDMFIEDEDIGKQVTFSILPRMEGEALPVLWNIEND